MGSLGPAQSQASWGDPLSTSSALSKGLKQSSVLAPSEMQSIVLKRICRAHARHLCMTQTCRVHTRGWEIAPSFRRWLLRFKAGGKGLSSCGAPRPSRQRQRICRFVRHGTGMERRPPSWGTLTLQNGSRVPPTPGEWPYGKSAPGMSCVQTRNSCHWAPSCCERPLRQKTKRGTAVRTQQDPTYRKGCQRLPAN